ncbi:methyltransferase family protein [Aliiruegeria haliotis]|uniref:Methyltransferase family protein n=1 Tax=Aliiruegeria haliotis TaxID=1280846 RepID=A0A2T0REC4_9RHOB|nr:methyltransferase domain-containing protein [Aliiruegeria haliotis]PRY19518.1 methyltransferase family protein [Aliiruegeria haliotis]
MSDLYLSIADQPDAVLDAIATSMDDRINDPNMQEICADYMGRLPKPGKDVLEIGCGNGASTEMLLKAMCPGNLLGIDPADGLLDRARERFRKQPEVSFKSGDAISTAQADGRFDIVVAHTVYSHLPDPLGALREAFRVLKPGGTLAVFDGDYATNTVALFEGDPLQAAMVAAQRNFIHDLYIMRRLPGLMKDAGFEPPQTRAHGFVQTSKPDYLLSLLARGIDAGHAEGEFGASMAEGFKAEAERRARVGAFYGAILFISAVARKPEA